MKDIILPIFIFILGLISRKYIEPIMPEQKKMYSYIKKTFSFIFKYVIIIVVLIFSFKNSEIDKLFIFSTCFFICTLFFNLFFDFISYFNKDFFIIHKQHKTEIEKLKTEIELLKRKK